jgi:hypothetical protein
MTRAKPSSSYPNAELLEQDGKLLQQIEHAAHVGYVPAYQNLPESR